MKQLLKKVGIQIALRETPLRPVFSSLEDGWIDSVFGEGFHFIGRTFHLHRLDLPYLEDAETGYRLPWA